MLVVDVIYRTTYDINSVNTRWTRYVQYSQCYKYQYTTGEVCKCVSDVII